MANGLSIDERGFSKLPQNQQMATLYRNTEELKTMVTKYKVELKVHRIVFAAFVGIMVAVFNSGIGLSSLPLNWLVS